MKKISLTLVLCMAILCLNSPLFAQNYTYSCWTEASGIPLDFMTLGNAQHPYAQASYSNSYNGFTGIPGSTGSGLTASHALITQNLDDPCRCYQLPTGYRHEKIIPHSWDDSGNYQDKVIRIGCYGSHSSPCTKSQQMEYWFVPPKDSCVLLVYFTFSLENKESYHCACCNPDLSTDISNPQFIIEVVDAQTGQPINNTPVNTNNYYPQKNSTTVANPKWPYSRFTAVASGYQSTLDEEVPNDLGYSDNLYYWACPDASPTTFPFRICPREHTSGYAGTDVPTVKWFEYKPLAFNLSSYANNNRAVKLRIKVRSCSASAHWAYGMYAAKLIPGQVEVTACGDEPIELGVPWGFIPDSYVWQCGSGPDGTLRYIEVGDVGVSGTSKHMILDPTQTRIWPYYRCNLRSYTGVPFTYEAYVIKYDISPNFSYEQITDPDHPCSHIVTLNSLSQVGALTPNANGTAYDTTFQKEFHLKWSYKNDQGEYVPIANSEDDTVVTVNFSNLPDIDLTDFDYTLDSINIKLVVQDSLRKCIDSIMMNIPLDSNYVKVGTSDTTVFACQDKLPYFFGQNKYGERYRFDRPGTMDCHVGADANERSWNYCDSIVKVRLDVMQPQVEINDLGDYCDSFRTTLTVVPLPGQPYEQADIHVINWNGDDQAHGLTYIANLAGVYTVDVTVGDAGCGASASYKIPACKPFINLPNTITPSNHDGMNDCFELPQKSLVKSIELTIYNRQGTAVFHTTDVNFKWRGARFSEDYPDPELCNQTYVYTLKMVDFNGKPYPVLKGSILVL